MEYAEQIGKEYYHGRTSRWYEQLGDSPHTHLLDVVVPTIKEVLKGDLNSEKRNQLDGLGMFMSFLVYRDRLRNYTEGIYEKPAEVRDTHYPYIPLVYGRFFPLLNHLPGKVGKFIDVGCGIGDKVVAASLVFGADAYGIEYTPQTYYIGKHFVERLLMHHRFRAPRKIHLELGDAFDHDFKEYDTIYLYHPIEDYELMTKLYLHIFESMKGGAILVEAMRGFSLRKAIEQFNNAPEASQRLDFVYLKKYRGRMKPLTQER